ncbi:FecR family protein [Catenovulum sediminis]|uniref:FecR family protein n=1 Tax=Catenovulum sediminis TaxID=1740262 RepID=A0ABV1REL6_9ALTE|nr:FecR family protein [Catenovulum sediminis]
MKKLGVVFILLALNFSFSAGAAEQQQVVGKTILAVGKVEAVNSSLGKSRKLKRRSPVFEVDSVKTSERSRAQFSMSDGSLLLLKENSEIHIQDYQSDDTQQKASATLDLVRGGLRSISGEIKQKGGDFKVKTPVGTIGIRGTHYEIEIIQGEVFIAVWDGAVDVQVDVAAGEEVSLGQGEDFSYAKIDESGEVTELLSPPENFNQGQTNTNVRNSPTAQANDDNDDNDSTSSDSDTTANDEGDSQSAETEIASSSNSNSTSDTEQATGDDNEDSGSVDDSDIASTNTNNDTSDAANTDDEPDTLSDTIAQTSTDNDITSDISEPNSIDTETIVSLENELEVDVYQEELWQADETPIVDLIAQRQGVFDFANVTEAQVFSSAGAVTNFDMQMSIDFDTGAVPGGFITFDDPQGNWFVTYTGRINVDQLELDVTFAAHDDLLADGDINARFSDGIDEVTGNFNLAESDNPDTNAQGGFILTP